MIQLYKYTVVYDILWDYIIQYDMILSVSRKGKQL